MLRITSPAGHERLEQGGFELGRHAGAVVLDRNNEEGRVAPHLDGDPTPLAVTYRDGRVVSEHGGNVVERAAIDLQRQRCSPTGVRWAHVDRRSAVAYRLANVGGRELQCRQRFDLGDVE